MLIKYNLFSFVIFVVIVTTILTYTDDPYYDPDSYRDENHSTPKDSKEYLRKIDQMKFICLGKFNETEILKMPLDQKLELFKKSNCPPIIMLPGYLGSKMEFKMKNCDEFRKFHPNIMEKCGWKDCNDKSLQNFPIWINTNIDISKIMGYLLGDNNNSKNIIKEKIYIPHFIDKLEVNGKTIEYEHKKGCFGSLFRLYYEKDSQGIKVTNLKGAEIKILKSKENACGLNIVSDYLGSMFPNPRAFKGFSKIDEFLNRLGYTKGLNLFYHPYDFRLPMDKLIRRIHNTVKIAYKITKKQAIIVGHSLGGLLAYKYSLEYPELVSHIIPISSPFLGSFKALDSLYNSRNIIQTEKNMFLFGFKIKISAKIDEESQKLLYSSFHSAHLLPKEPSDYESITAIQRIKQIENEEFSKHFFNFFPQNKCKSLKKSTRHNHDVCEVNFKKFSFKKHNNDINNSLNKIFEEIITRHEQLLNNGVHDDLKISSQELVEHLQLSQESSLLNFQQPNVPVTFIFSQHLDTPIGADYYENSKPTFEFTSGDGTVDGFSQIYPGLKWFYTNFRNKSEAKPPIHFVEYCAKHDDKTHKIFNPDQTGFITISCDCLEQKNLNSREECSHTSIISDSNLLLFFGDFLNKFKSKTIEVPKYKNLYELKFNKKFLCSHLE